LVLLNHFSGGAAADKVGFNSNLAVLFVFVVSPVADSLAYVFGRCLKGKFPKKMAPKLSPNKTVVGGIGGYLWFNAQPSQVLMGDAGSRFLGILVGAATLVTGNPLLVLAFAPIVLVNGGGGLGKLVLLRIAKRTGFDIGEENVIRRIRFPLHDHCKKNLKWSNAQVLMRFTLLQLIVMPILLVLIIKVR
jgi:UDP-N-acetylmuramyl pentapeptide phosphotransferase/UDP-N-acetylglucosamine-1-phosphate transferase